MRLAINDMSEDSIEMGNKPVINVNNKIPGTISPGSISLKYFDSYLRVCYYFGICPSRFDVNQDGHYQASCNWFQMAVCIMYAILTILIRMSELRENESKAVTIKKHELEPEEYFLLARATGLILYVGAIFHAFWFNTKHIVIQLKLARQYCEKIGSKRKSCLVQSRNWFGRNQVELWLIVTAFYALASLVIAYWLDVRKCSWNLERLLEMWSQKGQELIFITTNSNSTFIIEQRSKPNIAFAIFNVLAIYADNVFLSFGDMFLIICALLLLAYVQEFEMELENISKENILNHAIEKGSPTGSESQSSPVSSSTFDFCAILEEYDMIQELVNGLNNVIGLCVLGQTLGALPYFVTDFLDLLNPSSTLILIRVLLYFANLFIFIILAAMVNQKAQSLETWMGQRKNYLFVERSGATIGIKEMIAIQQGKNVGISAGRFFVITSEFVGSWISLLLTFAIVIMEFRSS